MGALAKDDASRLNTLVEAFRRGQQPKTPAGISYDALQELRKRCAEAEEDVRQLRAANAKLVATAEAYRLRAERAEAACADSVRRAYGFVAAAGGRR